MIDQGPEATFDRLGLAWERARVAVADIDAPASAAQQYRLETVRAEVVDQYAAAMERGEEFPPIIVRQVGDRLVLLGGMHRTAAARQASVAHLEAYVLDCTDAQARLVAYDDNARHGQPLSPAERGEMAARLVEYDGFSQAAAAAEVGTTQAQVSNALASRQAHARAVAAGALAADLDKLDRLTLRTLGRIDDDEVFGRAIRFAAAVRLGSNRAMTLAHRVRDATCRADALQIIREEEAIGYRRHNGGRGVRQEARFRLADALATILELDPQEVVATLDSDAQAHALAQRMRRAGTRIVAIGQALEAR